MPISIFFPFDTLPLQTRRPNPSQASHRHTHIPRLGQRANIRDQHTGQILGRDGGPQRRGTCPRNRRAIKPSRLLQQARQQAVLRHILGNTDEQHAAERLHEHDQRGADGQVRERKNSLHRDQRLLHREANTEAVEDLVADPFRRGGVDCESGQEPRADGLEDGAHDEKGCVVTDCCYAGTTKNGHQDQSEDEGKTHDSGGGGGDGLDGLEPDGEVESGKKTGNVSREVETVARQMLNVAGRSLT
ncbi:MAG: hypothetical protein Q9187_003647 [Circinaria calcarea]